MNLERLADGVSLAIFFMVGKRVVGKWFISSLPKVVAAAILCNFPS